MTKGEYKKILWEIFDVIGLSESEKETALQDFKKKLAFDLLKELEGQLSQEQKDWISSQRGIVNQADPNLSEIRDTIKVAYPEEEFDKKSREVFGKILKEYASFMSQKLDAEKADKIKEIVNQFYSDKTP